MDVNQAVKLIDDFFATGKELRFNRKEAIIAHDKISENAFWITSGAVKVSTLTDSSKEQVHHIYKDNEMFPISWMLHKNRFGLGFTALTTTTVRVLPAADVLAFFAKNPSALIAVVMEQGIVYEQLIIHNIVSAEARVAASLQSLARRFGTPHEGHIIIHLPMTIQEFAESVRLSRETAGRILKCLEENGAIIMSRQRIVVYPDKLDKFCTAIPTKPIAVLTGI
jgi:CRP-like cAMP-binding protein